MAEQELSLVNFLDRAQEVSTLATSLGQAFQDESEQARQREAIAPEAWNRHKSTFDQYSQLLLALAAEINNPPNGSGAVAKWLAEAAKISRAINGGMKGQQYRQLNRWQDSFPDLNSVAWELHEAIGHVRKTLDSVDSFAFLNDPTLSSPSRTEAAKPHPSEDAIDKVKSTPATFKTKQGETMDERIPLAIRSIQKHIQSNPGLVCMPGVNEAAKTDRFMWAFGVAIKAIGGDMKARRKLYRRGKSKAEIDEGIAKLQELIDQDTNLETLVRSGDWWLKNARPLVAAASTINLAFEYLDGVCENLSDFQKHLALELAGVPEELRYPAEHATECLVVGSMLVYKGLISSEINPEVQSLCLHELVKRLRIAVRCLKDELDSVQVELVRASGNSHITNGIRHLTAHHAAYHFGQLVVNTEILARDGGGSYLYASKPGTLDWSDPANLDEDTRVAKALAEIPLPEDPGELLLAIKQEALTAAATTPTAKPKKHGVEIEKSGWITISEAERISGINKGVISRAATDGKIKTNGEQNRKRRLSAVGFANWVLERSPTGDSYVTPTNVEERAREARKRRGIIDQE